MPVGPILYKRNESITQTVTNSTYAPVTRTVVVCKRGAEVDGTQNDVDSITVKSGHGFAAADNLMISTDNSAMYEVESVTATTIVLVGTQAVDVTDGAALVNLGNDTGSATPNFDGTSVPIYSRASTTTALNLSTVTSSSTTGTYTYWSTERQVWEVILTSGTPTDIIRDLELDRVEEVIDIREVSAGPTIASTADRVRVYMKDNNLVYQFYDGATNRYKWLPLDVATISWSAATTEPS